MIMDVPIEKKKGLKRKHIYAGVAVVLFATIIYMAFFSSNISTYRVDENSLTIDTVKQGVFYDYISVTGHVRPQSVIYLAAREGGNVEKKLVEEGATLKKGQTIVRLSNPDLNLAILNSEAQLAEKSNFLRNTIVSMEQEKINIKMKLLDLKFSIQTKKRDFEHQKKLYESHFISKEKYLIAKETYEHARKSRELYLERQKQDSIYRSIQIKQMNDDLANMKENLHLIRERQKNLNVTAPVNGQLTSLDVQIGQSVPQGAKLGQIDILNPLKLVAEIDESYIDRVTTGLTGIIDRGGKEYKVTISKVLPDVKKGRFTVEMTFDNDQPENLRIGQALYIRLQLGNPKKSLLLPRGPFFQETGGQWIFVVSKDGTSAEKRSIKIGRQNPQYYELLGGLKAGERVVTSGYENYGNSKRLILK